MVVIMMPEVQERAEMEVAWSVSQSGAEKHYALQK